MINDEVVWVNRRRGERNQCYYEGRSKSECLRFQLNVHDAFIFYFLVAYDFLTLSYFICRHFRFMRVEAIRIIEC